MLGRDQSLRVDTGGVGLGVGAEDAVLLVRSGEGEGLCGILEQDSGSGSDLANNGSVVGLKRTSCDQIRLRGVVAGLHTPEHRQSRQ